MPVKEKDFDFRVVGARFGNELRLEGEDQQGRERHADFGRSQSKNAKVASRRGGKSSIDLPAAEKADRPTQRDTSIGPQRPGFFVQDNTQFRFGSRFDGLHHDAPLRDGRIFSLLK